MVIKVLILQFSFGTFLIMNQNTVSIIFYTLTSFPELTVTGYVPSEMCPNLTAFWAVSLCLKVIHLKARSFWLRVVMRECARCMAEKRVNP